MFGHRIYRYMKLNLLIKIILVFLGVLYIALQAFQMEIEGSGISTLILVFLTILYWQFSKIRKKSFLLFLILFTSAQLIGFLSWFLPLQVIEVFDFPYYLANTIFILSYICLIQHILNGVGPAKLIKRYPGPAIILLLLDVFCVYIVTETAGTVFTAPEYILEFVYNGVIMLLLSVALLNYLYKDSGKAMLFLIGTIFIVFSEIIQLAYFYVLESNDLSATYATFLVMAFLFFYLQSQLHPAKHFSELQDENFTISQ